MNKNHDFSLFLMCLSIRALLESDSHSVRLVRSILDFEQAAFELMALNLDFFLLFYLFIHENQINCFDFRERESES